MIANMDDDDVHDPSGEVSNESQKPLVKKAVDRPSAEEIKKHNVTHLPFRNWCPICVAARARDDPHVRLDDDRERGPEVHYDYCFLRNEAGEKCLTTLVCRDRPSRVTFSYVTKNT